MNETKGNGSLVRVGMGDSLDCEEFSITRGTDTMVKEKASAIALTLLRSDSVDAANVIVVSGLLFPLS